MQAAGWGIYNSFGVFFNPIMNAFGWQRAAISGEVSLSMLIFPLISHWLTARYNWQTAVAVLGVLILSLFLVLSQLLVRDPASRGLSPDGDGQTDMGMAAVAEEGPAFLEAFRSTQVWMICAAYFILTICTMTILLHIVPHAIDLGVAKVDAARVLATIGAVSIAGRFFMGFVSDKTGNRRCYFLTSKK